MSRTSIGPPTPTRAIRSACSTVRWCVTRGVGAGDRRTAPRPGRPGGRFARRPGCATGSRKRLAWLGTYVFLAKNGVELDPDDDDAYDFVIGVGAGDIDDVDEIAAVLSSWQRRAPGTVV